jgi:hypothetical protein
VESCDKDAYERDKNQTIKRLWNTQRRTKERWKHLAEVESFETESARYWKNIYYKEEFYIRASKKEDWNVPKGETKEGFTAQGKELSELLHSRLEEEKTEETKIILWLVITFTHGTNTETWKKRKIMQRLPVSHVPVQTHRGPLPLPSLVKNTNSPACNQHFDTAVRLQTRIGTVVRALEILRLPSILFAEPVVRALKILRLPSVLFAETVHWHRPRLLPSTSLPNCRSRITTSFDVMWFCSSTTWLNDHRLTLTSDALVPQVFEILVQLSKFLTNDSEHCRLQFLSESMNALRSIFSKRLNFGTTEKLAKLHIIRSVHFSFIFKVQHMYNSFTLIVHFHRATCFEPLTWVHLQGHII